MSNERLLIIEDERIIAIDLQHRLERNGFTVVALGASGEQAVELAREHQPDLILMDIMMPGKIDGIDAARIIKEELSLPVIFLTAYSDEKTLGRAKIAEPAGYILKPFKEKELYTTIDIALYKYRADKQMKAQKHWYQSILTSLEEGVVATDMQRVISFVNPEAERILGITMADLSGLKLTEGVNLSEEKSGDHFLGTESMLPMFFKDSVIQGANGVLTQVEGSFVEIVNVQGTTEGYILTIRDITELKRMYDTINYQATHDPLTGLANRTEFSSRLKKLLKDAKDTGGQHSFIYLDMDQFKVINDTAGHQAGDELLIQTSAIIKQMFRESDFSARLGSDEFGVLLKGSNNETAIRIADRFRERLANHKIKWGKNTFSLSASMGVVPITASFENHADIMVAADDAYFLSKEQGGNKVTVYESSSNMIAKRRGEMKWISRITSALEEDRFLLYFHPIKPLDPAKGYTEKLEILIRMLDPQGRIIMPGDFIPAAERYALSPALDRWVLEHTFEAYAGIYKGKKEVDRIFCVNLTAASIADDATIGFIKELFHRFQIPPEAFCFEVTEGAAISNMGDASRFITELKETGCTFALDDFGSGFSSLNYLKNLPVDFLKIDGSFVKDMYTDSVNAAMVEAINNLGHVIGIQTIAEFVASEEIIHMLTGIGVDFAQGFFLAKPQPIDQYVPRI